MIVRGKHPHLRQFAVGMMLLAPAMALFIIFVAVPAVMALLVSTEEWTGFSPRARPVGLQHYRDLFGPTVMAILPFLAAVAVACVVAMSVGRWLGRAADDARRRHGIRLARNASLALAGFLLAGLLVWTYGPWNEGDGFFRSCVRNNFTFMIVGGVFHLVFAFMFASALSLPAFRGKVFFRTMIFFPSFISAVGVAMLWQRVYDTRAGLLNFGLQLLAINPVEWLSGHNMLNSIIACGVWSGVGSQMILLLAGMQRIPETYYEAARIDGASDGQVLRHVTLPLLRDVILIVVTLWVIGSLKVFGLVQAFAIGAEETWSVISVRQYELAFSNRDNIYMMGYATAMSVVLLVLVVVFAAGLRALRQQEQVEY